MFLDIAGDEKPYAYVGKADNFSKRLDSHLAEMEDALKKRGSDENINLLKHFIEGHELVFIPAIKLSVPDLETYERFCMDLMEEYGFTLDNINRGEYNLSEEVKEECRAELEEGFQLRFETSPGLMAKASLEERKEMLEKYAGKRLESFEQKENTFAGDRFIFSRAYFKNKLGEKSLAEIDLGDQFFFSKAGNYIGDGLDQIIDYESRAIAKHGYCLWTFAGNAIARETIHRVYKQWAKEDKGVYAILTMTFSQDASDGQKTRYPVLKKDEANIIKKAFEGKTEAFFGEMDEVQNGYLVADDIDVTAKGAKKKRNTTCEAFVIEQLYLLDRTYNPKQVADFYGAVQGDDTFYAHRIDYIGTKRSSFFMRRKESAVGEFWKAGIEDGSNRMSFLAKLAPPYVVVLSDEDPLKEQ